MTTAASLSITKADNTTSVTYNVMNLKDGKVTWRESGATNLLAAIVISAQPLPVKKGSQLLRKRLSIYMPVMETATGANSSGYTAGPKVAFVISTNFDYTTHLRATEAQNLELLALAVRLLAMGSYGNQITYFLTRDESIV